jgi:hypothetical protein
MDEVQGVGGKKPDSAAITLSCPASIELPPELLEAVKRGDDVVIGFSGRVVGSNERDKLNSNRVVVGCTKRLTIVADSIVLDSHSPEAWKKAAVVDALAEGQTSLEDFLPPDVDPNELTLEQVEEARERAEAAREAMAAGKDGVTEADGAGDPVEDDDDVRSPGQKDRVPAGSTA